MNKTLLVLFFASLKFGVEGQNKFVSRIVNNIDSQAAIINKQHSYLLSDCDSIGPLANSKEYKCWNYYFADSSQKELTKVTISFNGFIEWAYYYKNGKIIKMQSDRIIKGVPKYKHSEYFDNDKRIYSSGYFSGIVINEVDEAYYLRDLAYKYSDKK